MELANFSIELLAFLFLVALVAGFLDTLNEHGSEAKVSDRKYKNLVVPSIGCYDGLFGPGTGSFFTLAGVSLRGQGLIDSTATAKTLNFSTNLASLLVFLLAGHIIWVVGVLMMLGQVVGAWLGSHCLLNISAKYLRYIVVFMCFAMLIKYIA